MKLKPIVQVVVPAVVLALLVISNPLAQQPEGAPGGKQKSVKQKNVKPNGVKQRSANQKGVDQERVNQRSGETARRIPHDAVAQSMVKGAGAGATTSDGPMARLLKVDGDVLVSTESGLVAGEQGGALQEGTRVITMANSHALLVYSDGCTLSLKPNERIEISTALPCDERREQARLAVLDPSMELILEGQTASIPALALSGLLQGGVATSTGLAGVVAIVGGREDALVSPN